ncbi:unnamed protein product [Larinioides sclopetarius]|uniref:Ig-like domain-containing protein n=1 Tax=Larinioides sclopetarius TaxID=280406 RepID=A0AAV2AFS4_9ARAC
MCVVTERAGFVIGYVSYRVPITSATRLTCVFAGFCMYGWTVIALLVVIFSYSMQSTGSSFSRSFLARLEESRRPYGSTQVPNCTENDSGSPSSVKCPPKNVQQSNRSMCCSFGIHNSSHSQNPCTLVNQGMSSAQHTPSYRPPPSDCVLRIPVVRRKRPVIYDLLSCEGSALQLVCEANVSCSDQGISWRKEGRTFAGRELRLQNVQRRDSGTYLCEVTDYYGRPRLGAQVTVAVQFPPVILVPKPALSSAQRGDVLECSTEASPSATISWYRDDVLLDADDSGHSISSDTTLCTTHSRILILVNVSSPSTPHNYTCVASNLHGRSAVTLLLFAASVESSSGNAPPEKRKFNVTGFIVGMLPPLFISFYIILKLGYRSRYAEERGEDDGFREEPFFISY